VHVEIDYPDVERDLNRWLPLVKWLLAIPHYVVLFFLAIGALVAIIVAWFAILFTGRYPRGLFDFVVGVGRGSLRVNAYAFLLVTDHQPTVQPHLTTSPRRRSSPRRPHDDDGPRGSRHPWAVCRCTTAHVGVQRGGCSMQVAEPGVLVARGLAKPVAPGACHQRGNGCLMAHVAAAITEHPKRPPAGTAERRRRSPWPSGSLHRVLASRTASNSAAPAGRTGGEHTAVSAMPCGFAVG
jgi:hypothetical protein